MTPQGHDDDAIARGANVVNNAMHQQLRLDRWRGVRDSLWALLDPLCADGARVALVGAGSCDDVPLRRIAERASSVDLVDFDAASTARARARLPAALRWSVGEVVEDVLAGAADVVLRAVRDDAPLPESLELPLGALGSGDYDLVVGDMLYTQLLHAGLIAIGVGGGPRQRELMQRYDPPLVEALVRRVQSSVAPGGHAVHVHDVACWSSGHDQPIPIDEALADPDVAWHELRRHDACDPHLHLARLGVPVDRCAWWRWPFEPSKHFLVRASVAAGGGVDPPSPLRRLLDG